MLINLHTHLEGRIRPSTAAELATEADIAPPPGQSWETAIQLTGPADLTVYLEKVAVSYPFFATGENLSRIACEAVEDAAADGLDYLELRFGPATHVGPAMSMDDVIRAMRDGVEEGTRRSGLAAGVVVAALRHHDFDTNLSVARAAAKFAGNGVVGFDLAGDELRYPALQPYQEAFAIAAAAGLGLTCHAAEAAPAQAARDAVELFGVTRIGHGPHLADDPEAMRWAADNGIFVEVCPTSNWYTGAITDLAAHPVRTFTDAGIPVVLGDDNPLQTMSPLSHERELLSTSYGYTEAEHRSLDVHGVKAAFATDAHHQELVRRLGKSA